MPYRNQVTGDMVPQDVLPRGAIARGDADLPIREIKIDSGTLNAAYDVEMDEYKVIPLTADSYLWTYGVAPCHVVAMYGWPAGDGPALLAFAHVSPAFPGSPNGLRGALKILDEALRTRGAFNVQTHIIGGQPSSTEEVTAIGGFDRALYHVRGIVEPLTVGEDNDALIVATGCGIGFQVFWNAPPSPGASSAIGAAAPPG